MAENKFNVNLPPIEQIGMAVKDVNKMVEFYTACGLGPFRVVEVDIKGFTYKGKQGDCRLRVGASMGPIVIEMIQVLQGETPHSDFIKEKGEGVHHIGFHVKDLETTLAEFAKQGITPVFRGGVPNKSEFAYLDTDRYGGLMIEVSQLAPDFKPGKQASSKN